MEWTDPWHLFPFAILLIAGGIFYVNGWVVQPEDEKKARKNREQQASWERKL